MDAGTALAIVAIVVSVLMAGVQYRFQAKLARAQHELNQASKEEERKFTAEAQLDRAREPLLAATVDLAGRLDNIRNVFFLDSYLTSADPHRSAVARSSTCYRFARYWCVVEALYDRVDLPQFQQDKTTSEVAALLRDVGKTFSTDAYGHRFMMWREEQRAVAELMGSKEAKSGCIGYATFTERYEHSHPGLNPSNETSSQTRSPTTGDCAYSKRSWSHWRENWMSGTPMQSN